MTIEKNTWHAKLFFWSLRVLRKFRDGQDWNKEVLEKDLLKNGTNLCEYIRITFLWMPLVVLLHVVFYGMIVAAFLVVPIALFGVKSYLKTTGTFIGAGIAIIIILISIVFICEQFSFHIAPRIRKVKRGEFSGFAKVFSEWVKAKKERVCPIVQFVENEKESVQ